MELNKKNIKRVLLLIACAILLYWGLNNLSVLGGLLSSILSLFSPLLIGVGIAYVMNLLLIAIERLWDKALKKAPELWRGRRIIREGIENPLTFISIYVMMQIQ